MGRTDNVGLIHSYEMRMMRGLAILMILLHHSLSHISQTRNVVMLTYALNHVHIVVFFVIAGVLFEYKKSQIYQSGLLSFIKNKSKRLLFPYIFWSLILALGVKLSSQIEAVSSQISQLGYKEWSVAEIIWNTLTMQNYYTQHLWFIYVLFFIYLVNYMAKDSITSIKMFLLLFAVVNIISLAKIPLPFLADRFLMHFCNFLFGRLIFRYHYWDKAPQRKITILSLVVIAGLEISEYFSITSFSYTCLGNFIWGIAGTQVILAVVCFVWKRMKKGADWLCWVGNASYPIYLLHNPYIVSGLSVAFSIMKITNADVLYILMCMVGSIFIPALLYNFLVKKHSKYAIVLGG